MKPAETNEHCYLIQLMNEVNQNVPTYKVGKSTNIKERMKVNEYKNCKVFSINRVVDCTRCETEIKRCFRRLFKAVKSSVRSNFGSEFFNGDITVMKRKFDEICFKHQPSALTSTPSPTPSPTPVNNSKQIIIPSKSTTSTTIEEDDSNGSSSDDSSDDYGTSCPSPNSDLRTENSGSSERDVLYNDSDRSSVGSDSDSDMDDDPDLFEGFPDTNTSRSYELVMNKKRYVITSEDVKWIDIYLTIRSCGLSSQDAFEDIIKGMKHQKEGGLFT
jgi:hypothetical protein